MMTTFNPQNRPAKVFRLTDEKVKALGSLAEFFCLSQRDLTVLSYGSCSPSAERTMRRSISLLAADGLTDWRALIPRIRKRGGVPTIWGLTKKGVAMVEQEGLSDRSNEDIQTEFGHPASPRI